MCLFFSISVLVWEKALQLWFRGLATVLAVKLVMAGWFYVGVGTPKRDFNDDDDEEEEDDDEIHREMR